MIARLVLLTNNELKLKNAKDALKNYGVEVVQATMDVPEVQSGDVVQIAEFSARYGGERLHTATLKVDVAFEIRALNGFPGPFVKYINQWLSPQQILQLMQDKRDRYAQFIDALSLYIPNSSCMNFMSTTRGYISTYVNGENGWGMDKIFVPDGYSDTLASLSDEKKKGVWNKTHWEQLGKVLQTLSS